MKWNKVPYVYGYKIYRLDKSTNTYKHVGTTVGASNTSFTDKGLEVETLYSYKVLAFYGTNSGAYNGGESISFMPLHRKRILIRYQSPNGQRILLL